MHATVTVLLATGTSNPLPGFLATVSRYVSEYGYGAIALLVFLEDFGVPVPGETILIAGAIDAGAGHLNVAGVGIIGFCAAVVGDNVGYAIGRFGGRALVTRWGRFVFLTEKRLDKTERFFDSHGGKIITIARFIEGLRQANGIIAGLIRMHWLKFVAFNALGAALWVGCWVSVGYYGGQHITAIYDYINRYALYGAIAAVVIIALWIALRLRKLSHRRQAASTEDEEAHSSVQS
jgi:membrane protein DedA with SNARE-associated domain